MALILGVLPVSDVQAAQWNQSDINGRVKILQFAGRPDLVNAAVSQWVQETFGYLGGIIQIPEINGLLMQAGREGWSESRIQGALTKTKFWKSHNAASRNWIQLRGSDPQSAEKMVSDAAKQILVIAQTQGVALSKTRARAMAKQIAKSGITDQAQITRMVIAEAKFVEDAPGGGLQTAQSQIQSRAREYGIRLTGSAAFDWAKRVQGGTATAEDVDKFLQDQARIRFSDSPAILNFLDQGLTVRQAMDPQLAQVADLLEVDPDTIDLTDAQWSPLIETDNGQGGFRVMSSSEAATWARGKDEFKRTAAGRAQGAEIAQKIAQSFGAVA